jgi:RNA polymerase sigma factor (sigma-70 family)
MTTDRQQLVAEHLDIVYTLARRYARRLPDTADIRELESAGTLGLMEAATRFDPSRGLSFKTFAWWRVRGAIVDSMRTSALYSRRQHLARERGFGLQRVALEDRNQCAGGVPADVGGDVWLSRRLRAALARMPRREARLLVWRYWRGLPQCALTTRLGVNPSRVSQLEKRALRRLRTLLGDLR